MDSIENQQFKEILYPSIKQLQKQKISQKSHETLKYLYMTVGLPHVVKKFMLPS